MLHTHKELRSILGRYGGHVGYFSKRQNPTTNYDKPEPTPAPAIIVRRGKVIINRINSNQT